MKKKYAINGLFLTQKITGIQRFAYEITKGLDQLSDKNEVVLVVPDEAEIKVQFKNISLL